MMFVFPPFRRGEASPHGLPQGTWITPVFSMPASACAFLVPGWCLFAAYSQG